jgi:hypothetical protein
MEQYAAGIVFPLVCPGVNTNKKIGRQLSNNSMFAQNSSIDELFILHDYLPSS